MEIYCIEALETPFGKITKGMNTSFGSKDCVLVNIMREVSKGNIRYVAFLLHADGLYKVDPMKQELKKEEGVSFELYGIYDRIEKHMEHRSKLPDNFTISVTSDNILDILTIALTHHYQVLLPTSIMELVYASGTTVEEFILRSMHDYDIITEASVMAMSVGGSPGLVFVNEVDKDSLDLNLENITEKEFI